MAQTGLFDISVKFIFRWFDEIFPIQCDQTYKIPNKSLSYGDQTLLKTHFPKPPETTIVVR